MRIPLIIAVLFLIGTAGVAFSQTPVEPIDVEITALDYSFPSEGMIALTAHLTLYNTLTTPAVYVADLEFYLDAELVATQEVVMSPGGSTCSGDPTCSIVCDVQTGAHCTQWETWTGAGCDPGDPEHTCVPIVVCACPLTAEFDTTAAHDGEFTATAVYDPTDEVTEADETNNHMTVAIVPVPVKSRTWGAIKSLFGT